MRAIALLLVAGLSGCLSCEPLLEVRNCLDHQCKGSDDALFLNWTASHDMAWPEITAAMDGTPAGEHHHASWTRAQESELWQAFGVSGDQRELIVTRGDETFRVRVLTCD